VKDETLVYPTGKVVGIAPDRESLEEVQAALSASGVSDDRVEVYCGSDAAEEFETDTEEAGPLTSALRVVQKALGEEVHRMSMLNDALEAGAFVVQVQIPEDDEVHEAEKRSVGNALHDGGAQKVAYYGKLAVEELQIGA
jgi:hypothetical protein